VLGISALTHEGTRELLGRAYQMLEEAPKVEVPRAPPVIRPPVMELEDGFAIGRDRDGAWRVRGGKVERAVRRTNLDSYEGLLRLHSYLKHKGIVEALRERGINEGDTVRIGDFELEWREEE
jgi:GTP-binding protein